MTAETKPKNRVVLIAEDNADIRDLVQMTLENGGYSVIAAADGKDAFELAVKHHPDVAVLDVMMPNIYGYELTRRIRAHAETGSTPIILLTASDAEEEVTRGYDAGADDYICKPFAPDQLLASVDKLAGTPS